MSAFALATFAPGQTLRAISQMNRLPRLARGKVRQDLLQVTLEAGRMEMVPDGFLKGTKRQWQSLRLR